MELTIDIYYLRIILHHHLGVEPVGEPEINNDKWVVWGHLVGERLLYSFDGIVSWSLDAMVLSVRLWEPSQVFFDDDDENVVGIIWDIWGEPSEVGSLPLLPLPVENLVREGEAGRDFKNNLILWHLQNREIQLLSI